MIIFAEQRNEIMETTYRRYPIGIQNFEDLRNNNCVYVDKTELIYRLTHSDKVYFLSRPRQEFVGIYPRSLFPRKEAFVRRVGDGTSGNRMDGISGVSHGFQ